MIVAQIGKQAFRFMFNIDHIVARGFEHDATMPHLKQHLLVLVIGIFAALGARGNYSFCSLYETLRRRESQTT